MRRPAYVAVVEKSRAACIAAVETYNRAATAYREESFAILMINAWELLLKARIMQENGGKASCLYERQLQRNSKGAMSKVKVIKRTHSGLPYTIGIDKACNITSGYRKNGIDAACIANIEALVEIRNSATHFIVKNPLLNKALTEISLAAVKNYVVAIQKWFGIGFSDLNIASIPISFDLDKKGMEAVAKKPAAAVAQFLAYMQAAETTADAGPSEYSFSVKVEFDLIKKKADGAVTAMIVGPKDNPDLTIAYDGDKIPPGFTWDYDTLTSKLAARFTDFKQNAKYHQLRKALEKDTKLCFERYLDPGKKSSVPKRFYNPIIITKFDPHYAK
jgi:hypothetical protein